MEIDAAPKLKLIAAVSYCTCKNGTRSNPIYSENSETYEACFSCFTARGAGMCSRRTVPQLAPLRQIIPTQFPIDIMMFGFSRPWFRAAVLFFASFRQGKSQEIPLFYSVRRYYLFHKFPSLVLITYAVNPVHKRKHTYHISLRSNMK
jgi:hypothetical protein